MSTRTERLLLMLSLDSMPDPGNMLSWTRDGEHLTADQLRTLVGFTLQDADDVLTLMRLDQELSA